MTYDDRNTKISGKSDGPIGVLDCLFPFSPIARCHGPNFRVAPMRANGNGAEIVYTIDGNRIGFQHASDSGNQIKAGIVAKLNPGEAEGHNLLDHCLAVHMPAGIPMSRQRKFHVA